MTSKSTAEHLPLNWRFLIDGRTISKGETIRSFRGEAFQFLGVHHPRKILATETPRLVIDGRCIEPGETITTRAGVALSFHRCDVTGEYPTVIVSNPEAPAKGAYQLAPTMFGGTIREHGARELFPSVFGGEIQEQHGPNGTWTRTAFAILAALLIATAAPIPADAHGTTDTAPGCHDAEAPQAETEHATHDPCEEPAS